MFLGTFGRQTHHAFLIDTVYISAAWGIAMINVGIAQARPNYSVCAYLHNISLSFNVECARGHPYFISEVSDYHDCNYSDMVNDETIQCGRPWVESTCPVCGSGIGGKSHTLKSDNKVARQLVSPL